MTEEEIKFKKAMLELKEERDALDKQELKKFLSKVQKGTEYYKIFYKTHFITFSLDLKKAMLWKKSDINCYFTKHIR